MSVRVRVYRNTGFGEHDIPDSIELLNSMSHFDTNLSLEIMDIRNIDEIEIYCKNFSDISAADYVLLQDDMNNDMALYPVINPHRKNADTAVLPLGVMDYINTYGGVRNLQILDGMTDRVHVGLGQDTYGTYDLEDELMRPTQPMQIETYWKHPDKTDSGNYVTVAEVNTDVGHNSEGVVCYTFTDPQDPEIKVSIPASMQANSTTYIYPESLGSKSNKTQTMLIPVDSKGLSANEMAKQADNRKSLKVLRSLGIDSCITNQVIMPTEYIDIPNAMQTDTINGLPNGEIQHVQSSYFLSTITGKEGLIDVKELPYINHPNCKNNRMNYSNLEKYGMISCAGDSCEFEPATIKQSGSYPQIRFFADPHCDGKPYFRWKTVNGNSTTADFFRCCISGMNWKQAPLKFDMVSGSVLNRMKFENQQNIAGGQFNASQLSQLLGSMLSFGGNAGNSQFTSKGTFSGNASMLGGIQSAGLGLLQTGTNLAANKMIYKEQRRSELFDFETSQQIICPQVQFPYNSEIIRDTIGFNGVLCYRYKYSPYDEKLIDKRLTMYGYKHHKILEKTDFYNRKYFNSIKCVNVEVTGHAKWVNEGIQQQLKDFVRIWHIAPSAQYYDNNPAV